MLKKIFLGLMLTTFYSNIHSIGFLDRICSNRIFQKVVVGSAILANFGLANAGWFSWLLPSEEGCWVPTQH